MMFLSFWKITQPVSVFCIFIKIYIYLVYFRQKLAKYNLRVFLEEDFIKVSDTLFNIYIEISNLKYL